MSIINSMLIRDAMGLLNEFAETQTASPEQLDLGLRVLNEMQADWLKDGIDLQYTPQTEAGAVCPIPDDAIPAVKHFLAIALGPYFGSQISPTLLGLAQKYYSRLTRDAMTDQLKEVRTRLPYGDGQVRFRDITTF